MELLAFVAALFVVAVIALRYAPDSRPTADSKEAAWADLGMHYDRSSPAAGEVIPAAHHRLPGPTQPRAPAILSGGTRQSALDGL